MRELPAGARVALLALAGCALFASVAHSGTRGSPYAPNDWLFSHVALADQALAQHRVPFNSALLERSSFSSTQSEFRADAGVGRLTFYATTMWHFWNGLPLQPTLLATLALLSGLSPEQVAGVPLGGMLLVLLTYATADVLLARASGSWASLAPVVLPIASAPLALDLRVLMPSTSLVLVALVLHLLLRRLLVRDANALALSMVPTLLLPFWYYTVTYFVILLFAGSLALGVYARMRRLAFQPLAPLVVCVLVPLALAGALLLNGVLASHVQLAQDVGASPLLGPDAGSDYTSHLNRQPWRSALLYAESAALFAPLAIAGALAARELLRGRAPERELGAFAQWSAGGAAFSALLVASVGISFLNRSIIYLAPLALLAALFLLARATRAQRRWALPLASVTVAAMIIITPVLVATATPRYVAADAATFGWMDARVPHDDIVYSSLEVSSVLFRDHGFRDALAFTPRQALLRDLWYSEDANTTVPYLASFDWFVLRKDVMTSGFEEFGPLREPISQAAYDKFSASQDLQLVFDNGQERVYHVALQPERYEPVTS